MKFGNKLMRCMISSKLFVSFKAELYKEFVSNENSKGNVRPKLDSKKKKKWNYCKKNLIKETQKNSSDAPKISPHIPDAALEMNHWYDTVRYSSTNSKILQKHTKTYVLVHGIIQSIIDTAVKLAESKSPSIFPPPNIPQKRHTRIALKRPQNPPRPSLSPPAAPVNPIKSSCSPPIPPLSLQIWPYLGTQKRDPKGFLRPTDPDEISISSFDSMDVRVEAGDVGGDLVSKEPIFPLDSVDYSDLSELWPSIWQSREIKGRFGNIDNTKPFNYSSNLSWLGEDVFSQSIFGGTRLFSWLPSLEVSADLKYFSREIIKGSQFFAILFVNFCFLLYN